MVGRVYEYKEFATVAYIRSKNGRICGYAEEVRGDFDFRRFVRFYRSQTTQDASIVKQANKYHRVSTII